MHYILFLLGAKDQYHPGKASAYSLFAFIVFYQ